MGGIRVKIFGKPEEMSDDGWKELTGPHGSLTRFFYEATMAMGRDLDEQEKLMICGSYCSGYLNGSADTYLEMQNKPHKRKSKP